MGPNGLVEDQVGMLRIAVNYYKELFAEENRGEITLSRECRGQP
jgi:hypothetical protein